MDDGDILCHPILVPSYLQEFDDAKVKVGAERNPQETEVIFYVNDLGAAPREWRIGDVQTMAKVSTVTAGSITLGVAVGRRQLIADQLLAKVDVIRAVRERVQLCQDPQTDFVLLRERLGICRINHILRVHGRSNEPLKSTTRLDSDLFEGSSRLHGRRHGTGHTQRSPVRNRVQSSARHRGSSPLGSPHSSQAAHPSNDTRRSPGWPSTGTTWRLAWPQSLK